jgi:hypothetical protein
VLERANRLRTERLMVTVGNNRTIRARRQLLAAKRDLRLEQELNKLDRFDVLILD